MVVSNLSYLLTSESEALKSCSNNQNYNVYYYTVYNLFRGNNLETDKIMENVEECLQSTAHQNFTRLF